MIETQLGLTALAALAPAAAAEDGEERFRAALGEVAEHMAEREWDDAHEALLEALEEHGEAPYVRLHRARIEQDLLRCLFWRDREEPDPRSLVSGELHKYSPSTGQLRLDYTPSTMGDFQWISDEGEVSDRPGKERVRFHPAVFQSDYSVEVEGDDYDPDVGFLVCVDFPLRYFAANLGQKDFERGRYEYEHPATLQEWDRAKVSRADIYDDPRWEPGDDYRIEVDVDDRYVEVRFNGRRVLKAKKERSLWGRVGFLGLRDFERVRIDGRAERAWIEGLVDAAVRDEWEAFRSSFRPEEHLPAWLLEAGGDEGAFLAALPGPHEPVHMHWLEKAFERFSGRDQDDDVAELIDDVQTFLSDLAEVGVSEPAMRYFEALVYHSVWLHDPASDAVARLRDLVPDFAQGRLLESQILAAGGDHGEAIEAYRSFLADHPDVALAWLLIMEGRFDEAQEVLRAALADGLACEQIDVSLRTLARRASGPAWNRVYDLETDHYRIESDIDNTTCRDAASTLERAYRLYEDELGPVPEAARFPVYVFSGESSYQAYAEDLFGWTPRSTAGLYHLGLRQLLIWNVPARDDMLRTVRHEGMHQYLHALVGSSDIPIWFAEGLAEYYEAAGYSGNRWELGRVNDEHLMVLRAARKELTPLKDLVRLDPPTFMAAAELHYPQSWAFVHFLRHSAEDDARLFDDLLAGLKSGRPSEELTDELFTAPVLQRLEMGFFGFLTGLEWEGAGR